MYDNPENLSYAEISKKLKNLKKSISESDSRHTDNRIERCKILESYGEAKIISEEEWKIRFKKNKL